MKKTPTKRTAHRLAAVLAFATALATGGAWAADCYWAGGTSSDWGTVANWTTGGKVPDNDGAFIRKDKFHNNFKSGDRAYLITFNAAHINGWRTFFNNCGTASEPIVLRANNASNGLTTGDAGSSDPEGIYIGTYLQKGASGNDYSSNAGKGDA